MSPTRGAPLAGHALEATATGYAELSVEAQLLARVLGGPRHQPLCLSLLERAGGLDRLSRLPPDELRALVGLRPALLARLTAALALGRRLLEPQTVLGALLRTSQDVYEALRAPLAFEPQESFWTLVIDARQRLRAKVLVGRGGVSSCPVSPGDAFRPLLREACCAVIFAHNHPSGDPSPSVEDRELTARLSQAGELLGIRVLDHVIVARQGYFSFLDAGLLGT